MEMIEFLANLNKINSTIHATTRTVPKSKGAGQRGQGLAVGSAFRRRQMASGTTPNQDSLIWLENSLIPPI